MALKMLRENKNKFDIVISDVHMPDMDGFKLLELVGLEMELPVIMLSANGDTKLVMKGITHGACDYLLKPVRMEELQNIWQHVIRRKKFDSRDQSSNSQDKKSGERNGIEGANSDADSKLSKKRKYQIVSDDDEQDENDSENEDPSTQKKPRVVWSVELHRKFVAAVNQLGLDKAVPKKVLELMNVEMLTRENVASHLQKYRLYLKRISYVTNQQANMAAALGGSDADYLRMNSVNFHNFNGFAPFHNNAMRSIPPAGVFGRLNTPAGLGMHGRSLPPPNIVQFGRGQVPRSSMTEGAKFQPDLLHGDQGGTVLQGMPTLLEFDRLQNKKGMSDDSRIFPIASNFTYSNNTVVSVSSNSLLSLPNSSLTMQGCSQERQSHETFGINSDFPYNPLDHNRSNSNWPTSVPSQPTPANSMENSRLNTECQAGLMGDNMIQNMSYAPKKSWGDHKIDLLNHADFHDGSANSVVAAESAYPSAQIADSRSTSSVWHRNTGFGLMAQPRIDSMDSEHNQMFENPVGTATEFKQGQFMEQGRPLGDYTGTAAGSLDDVVTALFKQDQDDNIEEWRFAM